MTPRSRHGYGLAAYGTARPKRNSAHAGDMKCHALIGSIGQLWRLLPMTLPGGAGGAAAFPGRRAVGVSWPSCGRTTSNPHSTFDLTPELNLTPTPTPDRESGRCLVVMLEAEATARLAVHHRVRATLKRLTDGPDENSTKKRRPRSFHNFTNEKGDPPPPPLTILSCTPPLAVVTGTPPLAGIQTLISSQPQPAPPRPTAWQRIH